MSIIIDGMDQSATNLPHLKKISKSTVNLWHLCTHLTGVIVHGCGSEGFLDFLQYLHDPNLTINILLKILVGHFKDLATTKLPEKLYVQLDNCGRENKNQFVLAFLALLVQEGVFTEVWNIQGILELCILLCSYYNYVKLQLCRLNWASSWLAIPMKTLLHCLVMSVCG